MFFILSKLLYFIIQPINWVLGLMLFALCSKNKNRKRKALVWAIILGFLFTNRFIVNQVYKIYETKTITADEITEPYDIGILLGGYSNFHILPRHDRHNFSHRGNRFLNTLELYKKGKVKKLLLSGGSGAILHQEDSEAEMMVDFLKNIGIPESDIIVEEKSRNTWENAYFTRQLLEEKYPDASCLLITSAWHMPRSMGCFRKAGVEFTPYSVDFITERDRWAPEYSFLPDRNGFYYWEVLIKEWVGYLAYAVKGYL
jgi:uncharacterized SAM-binding protein YcdF (DUF218 family)